MTRAHAAGLAAALLFALDVVVAKAGFEAGLTPWDVTLLRFLGSAPFCLFILAREGRGHLAWWQVVALVVFAGAPYNVLLNIAIAGGSAGNAAVLNPGGAAVAGLLIGWLWLGEAPRRALLATIALPVPALAQQARPVRIIVAQPPGGNLDILVRAIAEGLRGELGTAVVVENRAGGNGVIGLEACAQSAPDGTTFCAVNIENMASLPHVEPELFARYSSLRPVSQMASARSVIVSSLDTPPGDLRDFVAWARGRRGLNYGSSGTGSAQQLLFEWMKARDGLEIEHIPFRGIGDAFRELIGGRIQLSYGALALAMPQIRADRIRPLAVLGSQRIPELPDTPSLGELGYAFPYAGPWWGLMAPGGTPDAAVARVSAAIRGVVTNAEFAQRMLTPNHFDGIGSTPEAFGAVILREREASLELVRLAGLVSR